MIPKRISTEVVMLLASGEDAAAAMFFAIALIVFVIELFLGGLPGYIAKKNKHPSASAINVLGWIGIFTSGILWIAALIWAINVLGWIGIFTFGILWIAALIWALTKPITQPFTVRVLQEPIQPAVDLVPCLFCAEPIRPGAKICRFCNREQKSDFAGLPEIRERSDTQFDNIIAEVISPAITRCPSCGLALKVKEGYHGKGRCPKCSYVFPIG